MLKNRLYLGEVASADFGVSRRGDFEPLISEDVFYAAQSALTGRSAPRKPVDPDFPLRGFVHCETCRRRLTASRSKGRNGYYAYYHCQRTCRAVNVAKAKLEGAFVEELRRLQPSAGYMRLVSDRILSIWREVRAEVRDRAAEAARRAKGAQEKLDCLDDAFLFAEVDRPTDLRTSTRQGPSGAGARAH